MNQVGLGVKWSFYLKEDYYVELSDILVLIALGVERSNVRDFGETTIPEFDSSIQFGTVR